MPVSSIVKEKRGNREYYFAVHYEGYEKRADGGIRVKRRKCYLGPAVYQHAQITQPFVLRGAANQDLLEYLRDLLSVIRDRVARGLMDPNPVIEMLRRALAEVEEWCRT